MNWINLWGLIFMVIIAIPNIVFAITSNNGFQHTYHNKTVEISEKIGRFGCIAFMIINIPGTAIGWWSDEAFAVYLIVNFVLIALYCLLWVICFRKDSLFRALTLSVIPSIVFLFSGITSRSILLIVAAVLFAPSHIMISYQNAK